MGTTAAAAIAAIGLSAGLAALPAHGWELLAKLSRDGNGIAGPSELAGSSRTNKNKTVHADFTGGFPAETIPPGWPPTGSEIDGHASASLASGALHGSAHAVAGGLNAQHSMQFDSKLTETITLNLTPGTQAYDDWQAGVLRVWVVGQAHGTIGISGAAQANLHFYFTANNIRGVGSTHSNCVSYPTSCSSVWGGIELDSPSFQQASGGLGGMTVRTSVLVPISRQINIVAQLSGDAYAWSSLASGVGAADANASNTGWISLELPQGVSFSSQSGVFLSSPIPEPNQAALLLAGLGLIGWRRLRARAS
jgi:hypothetical protein